MSQTKVDPGPAINLLEQGLEPDNYVATYPHVLTNTLKI